MEKRKKRLLTVLIIAAALLLAAVAMACVDYNLVVNRHERPECAVGFATADDGASTYSASRSPRARRTLPSARPRSHPPGYRLW